MQRRRFGLRRAPHYSGGVMPQGNNLIYDIGAHRGEDTDFYLGKGFRVVAIEANPVLVEQLRTRFPGELRSGQLIVVDKAVGSKLDETISFFVNELKDDWSATDREVASKGTMAVTEVKVHTISLQELFAEHGLPYYLKVDIEGGDLAVAESLLAIDVLPEYASFEFHETRMLAVLEVAGYRQFQLVNQFLNGLRGEIAPPREGNAYWPGQFTGYHSGHFGRELPESEWVDFEEAMRQRLAFQHLCRTGDLKDSWFDLHARLG
jgi:FkbM family methyltransferase